MRIKITPFSPDDFCLEAEFLCGNCYYFGGFHSAGIVTEIKPDDDFSSWGGMSWIDRSEIPFITALRHVQHEEQFLVSGITPIIRKFKPFYEYEVVSSFPKKEECKQLVYKYCNLATDQSYNFFRKNVNELDVKKLFENFDYSNDLLIRAGTCLHKAYILLNTSNTFTEEIYINVYIALEAIIEHLKIEKSFPNRKHVIDFLDERLDELKICVKFREYEQDMRDEIRNDIIHPFRSRTKKKIAHPYLTADNVYEDLPLVDIIFKNLLNGEFY